MSKTIRMLIQLSLIITLSMTCVLNTWGQTYDKVATMHFGNGKELLNKTDSLGRKQGHWINYTMYFNNICSPVSNEKADTCFRMISEGYYKNNKKTGKWKYYHDGGDTFDTWKTETFCKDGSVSDTLGESTIITHFNPDSSIVTSRMLIPYDGWYSDTIKITCINKCCTAKYYSKVLETFDLSDLGMEQFMLSSQAYYRTIESYRRDSLNRKNKAK